MGMTASNFIMTSMGRMFEMTPEEKEKYKDTGMFARVQPGKPWWFWFKKRNGEPFIYEVCRDGSGGLWVEVGGHGKKLMDVIRYEDDTIILGPVAEW